MLGLPRRQAVWLLSCALLIGAGPAAAQEKASVAPTEKPLYTVVDGYKVDSKTMDGFRAWRAAAARIAEAPADTEPETGLIGLMISARDIVGEEGGFAAADEAPDRRYARDEWLEQVPTMGGHAQLAPAKLDELLAGVGAAIDAVGGGFTMNYATVAVTVARA